MQSTSPTARDFQSVGLENHILSIVFVISGGPDVGGRAKNGLEEAEKVDEGGDQGEDFGEVENV